MNNKSAGPLVPCLSSVFNIPLEKMSHGGISVRQASGFCSRLVNFCLSGRHLPLPAARAPPAHLSCTL